MNIIYSKLLPVHAKQYREIRLESLKLYPAFYGSTFEEQSKLPELRLERFIKQHDANHFVMGAFAEDSLSGISGLIGICGFVAHNDYDLDHTGTLIQMYVKEAFGGQKIGLGFTKAILAEAFKLANIKHVLLGVNLNNSRAIHVYEQAGFQVYVHEASLLENKSHMQLMMFHDQ